MSAIGAPGSGGDHPFGVDRRGLTVGLLLAVTLNALTALALVTIAPLIPAELGGLEAYGWLFSSYLLTSLLGTVWGGAEADRFGLRRPFAVGLLLFAVGLLLAGLAPSMAWVIAARALQGFGAGTVTTCVYVAITRSYPDHQRARLMALLSSAWVTPALIGPALAGVVAGAFGWRWVFLGLLPVLGLVAALTLPRFAPSAAMGARARRGIGDALLVVVGLGAALGSFTVATGQTGAWHVAAVVAVVAGASLGAIGLRRLLPTGTMRLARGLGALVAARGALFAGFIGFEAFLALMLTELHGLSSAATGAIIASGAISWAGGAWWQSRRDADRALPADRARRVALGSLVLGGGLAAQGAALAGAGEGGAWVVAVAVAGWMTAGFGIGVAHATSSVLAFALAEADGVAPGRVSSALQLSDNVGAAVVTGLGGAALALVTVTLAGSAATEAAALRGGVAAAFGVAACAWLLSYVAARRSDRRAPTPAAPP